MTTQLAAAPPPPAPSGSGHLDVARGHTRVVVPSVATALRPTATFVATAVCGRGVRGHVPHAIELAVHEVLANALEHGHGGEADERIEVEVSGEGGLARVLVRDAGRGGRAGASRRAREERGRGLSLILAGCDRARWRGTARRGTEVELRWWR